MHCLSSAGIKDNNELTKEECFSLFDQMKKMNTDLITIGGGEPLLRKDLFEIIEYGVNKGIKVSIVTNGILMTDSISKKLNNFNLDTVTFSIDGLEDNHDYIRGKGNFKRTINGIKIFRERCQNPKVAIRMTVNSRNFKECVKVIKLAEKLNVDVIRLTPILLLGRAKINKELILTRKQYISFLNSCKKYQSKIEVILPAQKESPYADVNNFGCHCGKEACWITQTGDVSPCIFFGDKFCAGNLRKESLSVLWNRSQKKAIFCGNPVCKSCSNYKKCRGGCRARALAEYNDINAVDPLCPLNKNNPVKGGKK